MSFEFPLPTATTNERTNMTSPFDMPLPDLPPAGEFHNGIIEALSLKQNDSGDHYFSMKIRADDPNFEVFDTYLAYTKDGGYHKMAKQTAGFIAVCIGGTAGRSLCTASGESSEEALKNACDAAVRTPVRFKLKQSKDGKYTNLAEIERL